MHSQSFVQFAFPCTTWIQRIQRVQRVQRSKWHEPLRLIWYARLPSTRYTPIDDVGTERKQPSFVFSSLIPFPPSTFPFRSIPSQLSSTVVFEQYVLASIQENPADKIPTFACLASLVDPATHGFHPSSSIGSAPNNSNTPLPPASDPSPSNPPPPARQLSPKAQSFVPSTTLSSSTPSTEVQSLHPPTRNALPGSFSTASTSGASANQGRSYSEDFRIGLSQAGTAPSRVIARVPSGRPVPAWADQSVPPAYAEQANSNRPRSTRPPLGAGGVAPTPLPNYRRETTSTTSSSSTPRPLDSIPRRRNGYLDLDSIPSSIEELRKGLRVPWNNDAQKTKGTVDRKRSNTFEAFQADATSKTLVVFLSVSLLTPKSSPQSLN